MNRTAQRVAKGMPLHGVKEPLILPDQFGKFLGDLRSRAANSPHYYVAQFVHGSAISFSWHYSPHSNGCPKMSWLPSGSRNAELTQAPPSAPPTQAGPSALPPLRPPSCYWPDRRHSAWHGLGQRFRCIATIIAGLELHGHGKSPETPEIPQGGQRLAIL